MSDVEQKNGLERRQLVMLVALGAVLLVLVYLVFLKGGGDPESAPVQSAPPIAQAEPGEDPFDPESGDAGDAGAQPVETYEVFASRDPFEPVIKNGSAAAGADAPSDDPGAQETDEEPQDPTDDPGNEPDEPDEPTDEPAGPKANEESFQGHTVTLIDTYRKGGKDKAQVQIDSTSYTVDVGEVFAENFQLVSVSGQCATMLYGDDQFTLCEGEEILK